MQLHATLCISLDNPKDNLWCIRLDDWTYSEFLNCLPFGHIKVLYTQDMFFTSKSNCKGFQVEALAESGQKKRITGLHYWAKIRSAILFVFHHFYNLS